MEKIKKVSLNIPTIKLTHEPQFYMVYTVIDHRNELIKCSKLKWNHEPQACWVIYYFVSLLLEGTEKKFGRTAEVSAIIKDLYKLTENPLPPFLTHTLEEVTYYFPYLYTYRYLNTPLTCPQ